MKAPAPLTFRCRVRTHREGKQHELELPARLVMPLGQTIVTLIDGCYWLADVVTIIGEHRSW